MVDRTSLRSLLVPGAARMLRSRDFRTVLQAADGSRDHVVIVALDDDPMSYVFERFREAPGSSAVLFTANRDCARLATMRPTGKGTPDDDPVLVDDHSTVGMFFTYLAAVKTATVCRVTAQFVSGGDMASV